MSASRSKKMEELSEVWPEPEQTDPSKLRTRSLMPLPRAPPTNFFSRAADSVTRLWNNTSAANSTKILAQSIQKKPARSRIGQSLRETGEAVLDIEAITGTSNVAGEFLTSELSEIGQATGTYIATTLGASAFAAATAPIAGAILATITTLTSLYALSKLQEKSYERLMKQLEQAKIQIESVRENALLLLLALGESNACMTQLALLLKAISQFQEYIKIILRENLQRRLKRSLTPGIVLQNVQFQVYEISFNQNNFVSNAVVYLIVKNSGNLTQMKFQEDTKEKQCNAMSTPSFSGGSLNEVPHISNSRLEMSSGLLHENMMQKPFFDGLRVSLH